ncbi:MAG: hypothetical protein Q8L76_06015 [Cypionkella sp.]|nr:hypothetical protein [Cypionkella sp.]
MGGAALAHGAAVIAVPGYPDATAQRISPMPPRVQTHPYRVLWASFGHQRAMPVPAVRGALTGKCCHFKAYL